MSNALYLSATLPDISLGHASEAVFLFEEIEDFLESCSVLGEELEAVVRDAVLSPKDSDLKIAKRWSEYEYSIKNELGRRRWEKLRQGSYESVFVHGSTPVSADALQILQTVGHESDPLVNERYIISQQWAILDSLDAETNFKLENVIIYGWKLKLYYSYKKLTEERGKEQWNTLVSTLADKSGFSISEINGGF